jgi:low temperature requirement protein LtrA
MATNLERILDEADDRTAIGRDIFTYGHIGIIAGIILCAVGDEIVLAHPGDHLDTPDLLAVVAGPTLYLLAFIPTRWRLTHGLPWRRISGAIACVLVGFFAWLVEPPALVTGGLLVLALVGVIAHEYFFRWHRRDTEDLDAARATQMGKVAGG